MAATKPWYKQKGTWAGLIIMITAVGQFVTEGNFDAQAAFEGAMQFAIGLGILGVRQAL